MRKEIAYLVDGEVVCINQYEVGELLADLVETWAREERTNFFEAPIVQKGIFEIEYYNQKEWYVGKLHLIDGGSFEVKHGTATEIIEENIIKKALA